jgi:DNA helicase-2/ATP-dependent DNA helicase PcrA|tara:strand:- start:1789 stop:3306 length:1518 start_codon:yes stop_codon:yes gene_type:complete
MFRIFGPPGTGKTTTLLNMVDEALDTGTHPHRIAFLAFTRKAANEAKERAAVRFNLDPKTDLIYFRTLHSLALTMTDIKPEQVMQESHFRELSRSIGVSLGGTKAGNFDDDIPSMVASNDPILGLINLARLRKVPLREQYNASNIEPEWNTVNYVDRCLRKYKQSMGLYDFTDMLAEFVKGADTFCPDFDLCFLDEAQDLSPLQWELAHAIDARSKRMYCAGDDDQAIYRWAGADVDHFINLPGGSETLSQSYRVPKSVHHLAENVVRRIHRRFPKTYKPKEEPGAVTRISSIAALDMAEGSWLILAQAGYHLQPVASDLKSSGYLFNYRGHRSISEKLSDAVNGWEQLRQGKEVSGEVARKIYGFMSTGIRVGRGYKKLTGVADQDLVKMSTLIENYGLKADKTMIWSEAMDKLPEGDRAYITALLRRGQKFNGIPRITASTIHGSKGGEADNVVLFTDLSPAADNEMRINPDDMHRVFYVGVTRTRKALFIVDAEDVTRSYEL